MWCYVQWRLELKIYIANMLNRDAIKVDRMQFFCLAAVFKLYGH